MKKYIEQTFTLNNGVKMPRLGLGTFRMTDEAATKNAVIHALNFGYKMIDTADYYGNHEIIAQAIKESNVKREDIFLVTKVWPAYYGQHETRNNVNKMLAELDTDYLDLVLLHWPVKDFSRIQAAWEALEALYKQGKIRAIGVSNFMVEHLEKLLSFAKVIPVVDQVELHPGLPLLDLQAYNKEHGIVTESWQTIMRGEVDQYEIICDLATKYNVDAASIALRWATQQDIIIIPKSNTMSRIKSNASNLDTFSLTKSEIATINAIPFKRIGHDPYEADF